MWVAASRPAAGECEVDRLGAPEAAGTGLAKRPGAVGEGRFDRALGGIGLLARLAALFRRERADAGQLMAERGLATQDLNPKLLQGPLVRGRRDSL